MTAAGRFLAGATVAAPAALSLSSSFSGSASTLAQGVLTTMAMTQIKLIGAGVVATGVLLGVRVQVPGPGGGRTGQSRTASRPRCKMLHRGRTPGRSAADIAC